MRASARCSPSISWWDNSRAMRCASCSASCDFWVNFSGCMTNQINRMRGTSSLRNFNHGWYINFCKSEPSSFSICVFDHEDEHDDEEEISALLPCQHWVSLDALWKLRPSIRPACRRRCFSAATGHHAAAPPKPRKSRGWMIFAIILLVLLAVQPARQFDPVHLARA